MKQLTNSIKNKNKIRIWCSRKDSDSYILLPYICNFVKNMQCNLFVIYSDDYDEKFLSPAILKEEELESITALEHKLSNDDIIKFSKIWDNIKSQKADIRIMYNNELKLVSYDYFDNIIIDKLKMLGTVKESKLVSKLFFEYHLCDLIFVYLINRLIKEKRVIIVKKNSDTREFDNIISVSEN